MSKTNFLSICFLSDMISGDLFFLLKATQNSRALTISSACRSKIRIFLSNPTIYMNRKNECEERKLLLATFRFGAIWNFENRQNRKLFSFHERKNELNKKKTKCVVLIKITAFMRIWREIAKSNDIIRGTEHRFLIF